MAQLEIDVIARIAKFQDGLDSLQRDVSKAVSGMEASFKGLGSFIGQTLSLGTLGGIFKAAINDLAALDDAAEATGSSVETISAALNTLKNNDAGGLEDITDLTNRLGRALQNADKDTSKAADAFRKFGLNLDELKGKGRVDAILDLAKAQAQYADDAQKAIAIDAALGKGASQLISKLNELAKTQSSAATTTGEITSQAEKAAKQIATLQNNLIALRNDIVGEVLPSFNRLLINLRAFSELGAAPRDILAAVLGNEQDLDKQIKDREAKVARLRATQDELLRALSGLSEDDPNARPARRNAQTRLTVVNQELEAEGLRINQLTALVRRRADLEKVTGGAAVGAGSRGSVNIGGLTGGSKEISDGEKLLKQLQDRLFTTLELTEVQKLQADIARGSVKFDSEKQQAAALAAAAQIDSAKEIVALAERESKTAIERIRRYEELEATQGRANEEAAKAIKEQIQGWEDLANPLAKYQRELEKINKLLDDGEIGQAQAERFRRAQIDAVIDTLEKNREKAKEVDDAAKDLGLTFQSAFEDAVLEGERLSTVLQSLAKDVARVFLRKTITEPLVGAITGSIGSLFGGGGGGDELNPYASIASGAARALGKDAGATIINNDFRNSALTENVIAASVTRSVTAAKSSIFDDQARGRV